MKQNPIFPLFRDEDIDLAKEFLAYGLLKNNSNVKIVIPYEDCNNQIAYTIAESIIETMYGDKNIIQMANYLRVQDGVNESISKHLLTYLDLVGIKADLIEFIPNRIATLYLLSKIHNIDKNFTPYKNWDPDEYWDFSKNDKDHNFITNPLNGFLHLTLRLYKVPYNKDFLIFLGRFGLIKYARLQELIKFGDEKKISNFNIDLKLLPYDNFNSVLRVVQAIHKYL